MKSLPYFLLALSLCCLSSTCKDRVEATDMAAGRGITLSPEQARKMSFDWPAPDPTDSIDSQIFQLYRLDSTYKINDRVIFNLTPVYTEEVGTTTTVQVEDKDNKVFITGRSYAWDVRSLKKQKPCFSLVSTLSTFTIASLGEQGEVEKGESSRGLRLPDINLPPPPSTCERCKLIPEFPGSPNCILQCQQVGCGGPIVHTVNRRFNPDGLTFSSPQTTVDSCIVDTASEVDIFSHYYIEVPCSKRGQLAIDTINVLLFEDGVALNRNTYQLEMYLNGVQSIDYAVSPSIYHEYCVSNCTKCRVDVDVRVVFNVSPGNDGNPLPYTLAFDLSDGSSHGGTSSGSSHQTGCGTPGSPANLSYYECVDASATHAAQHITLFPIPFCSLNASSARNANDETMTD